MLNITCRQAETNTAAICVQFLASIAHTAFKQMQNMGPTEKTLANYKNSLEVVQVIEEKQETMADHLAKWIHGVNPEMLSEDAIEALKGRLLDSIGCAIGALEGPPVQKIRQMTGELGGKGPVTLIGGGKTNTVQASFYNGALIRYLDFNDSYLAKNETCHPSDNIAPVLAGAEYADATGIEFLLALAVAYQVHCRLSDVAPVRDHGFDHTVQGQYGAASGTSRAMGLEKDQIENAIAISGTGFNSLRVTRTGDLSNWKGLAYPSIAMGASFASLLAQYGITGPREVFEGNKGLMDAITGKFELDWSKENLESVTHTIIKQFNAEIHSQASIEGILELRGKINVAPEDIKHIHLETFDVAYNIIGGGEEGGKKNIRLKEEADHSLPYMLAAAYLDGNVMPEQYNPGRIVNEDVQTLLQKVEVTENASYSDRFPQEMACKITIETKNGEQYSIEKSDYEGFHTRPASRETLMGKYKQLTKRIDENLAHEIADVIWNLENKNVSDLTGLLEKISMKDGDNHEK